VSKILGILAIIAAVILAAFADVGNKLAAYMTAKAEATRKGVDELRKELQKLLGALETNVLVVIDDVDRLTPEGIRMVFQLVKANADFPNLVYLLLFQRDTVEKALTGTGEFDGSQFLEKVVQVGIDIPKLSPSAIQESIESAISGILQDLPAQRRFDTERWGKLFFSAIRPYFRTLRDVKRFANTLSFHFELYKNGHSFDANPIDLIALEVLRQFEAPLYNELFSARALLTGASHSPLGFNFSLEDPSAVDILIKKAVRQQEATEILSTVFPPFAWSFSKSQRKDAGNSPHAAAYRNEWLTELRACHPDVFERYFRFSLSVDDLSEAEMSSLLAVVGDRARLVEKLRELNGKRRLGAAIARLGAQKPTISDASIVPFATGLLDLEKELIAQTSKDQVATVPIDFQAVLIAKSVLRQRPATERSSLLREIISKTIALHLPTISFESTDEERKQTMDPLVSDVEASSLQELCVQKIRAASKSAELLSHPRLRYILRTWLRWGSAQEVTTWCAESTNSVSGLSALLLAFAEGMNQIGNSGEILLVKYNFALEDFSRYVNSQDLVERIRLLATSGSEQEWVYRLFLRAFDRWKATGKYPSPPELDHWTSMENLLLDRPS
jgi:predicted KAP-like P-loop ATPase